MFGFIKRLRTSSSSSPRKDRASSAPQRQLDGFQAPSPQEKKRPVSQMSIKDLENEVNDCLKAFQSYVKRMKEISLGVDELMKLLKSGEISESAYKLIMDELGGQLSISVDDIFELREALELARAKAKLEWAKEKVSALELSTEAEQSESTRYVRRYPEIAQSDYLAKGWGPDRRDIGPRVYVSTLEKWEDLISKIDAALSSLSIEEEAAIIEQYLSLIKEKISLAARLEEIEKGILVCRQRLGSISERWVSLRRSKIEHIMNLEVEASQVKDEIKELEVRFSVGETSQDMFESRNSVLQGNLKRVEKEISDVRKFIDDMDMKIFRCSELSREIQ